MRVHKDVGVLSGVLEDVRLDVAVWLTNDVLVCTAAVAWRSFKERN